VVDAVRRHVVDHHSADLDVLEGDKCLLQRVGEDSSLKAIFGVI
jgi:hypothetical protein